MEGLTEIIDTNTYIISDKFSKDIFFKRIRVLPTIIVIKQVGEIFYRL